VPAEVEVWAEAGEVLADTHRLLVSAPGHETVRLPEVGDATGLLEDYENLFVGPGQVPCPPYESFWREDVPVDIRRTLMGPCTAELKDLYRELGLQVSVDSGELPDHVAIELEALAYGMASPKTEGVARRICQEHLAKFVPRLCRAVTHDAESAFYRDLGLLTLEWMASIRGYFALVESG
jgi:TorA maturation chaperone TorD